MQREKKSSFWNLQLPCNPIPVYLKHVSSIRLRIVFIDKCLIHRLKFECVKNYLRLKSLVKLRNIRFAWNFVTLIKKN